MVHAHILLCIEKTDNKNVLYSADPVRAWGHKDGETIGLLHKKSSSKEEEEHTGS